MSEFPRLVETIETTLQGEGLNVLVNNAGLRIASDLNDVTEADMVDSFRVNSVAPLHLTQVRLEHLDDNILLLNL